MPAAQLILTGLGAAATSAVTTSRLVGDIADILRLTMLALIVQVARPFVSCLLAIARAFSVDVVVLSRC